MTKQELTIEATGELPRPGSVCPESQLHIEINPEAPTLEIKDKNGNMLFKAVEPIGLGPIAEPPEIIHFDPPYSDLVSRIVALEKAVAALVGDHCEDKS